MSNQTNAGRNWSGAHVYTQAAICLLLGVMCGYLFRGATVPTAAASTPAVAAAPTPSSTDASPVTPEQLKAMADKQAAPLRAQLQSKPNDPELLVKVGYVYWSAHDFKHAAEYYQRSVDAKDNLDVRIELGRAYYYAGDPDHALAEFERVAKAEPGNANALYNVGMIKWKDKGDAAGAIAAWRQLLKTNPNHPQRANVEQLIANARAHRSAQQVARN